MRSVIGTILTITTSLQVLQPARAVDSWGEEFCRASLCGIMPPARWKGCCVTYRRCCAYVEYVSPQGPFSFEEPLSNTQELFLVPIKPPETSQKPPEASQKPSAVARNPPSRSLPLQEASTSRIQADQPQPGALPRPQARPTARPTARPQARPTARPTARPQARPTARPQARPQARRPPPISYSLVKPRPPSGASKQPPRTYNDVIRKVDAMHCKAKYCSLLGADKQRRCCDVYSQCCAYANLPHSNNPFYFEKNPVNY